MGTTGASMLLIRPVLRANAFRKRKTHTFVFFIFLVSNIGGSLTPLGDPPLYLGFLKGVSFFWTDDAPVRRVPGLRGDAARASTTCWIPSPGRGRSRCAPRHRRARAAAASRAGQPRADRRGGADGAGAGLLAARATSHLLGETIGIERLVGIAVFLAIAWLSMRLTTPALREANGFAWGAIAEVAKLFAAIFVTMAPVLAILRAGMDGRGRAAGGADHGCRGAADPVGVFLADRRCCPPSSTMRRPTWCSSTWRAATRAT